MDAKRQGQVIKDAVAGDNPILQALATVAAFESDLGASGFFGRLIRDGQKDEWAFVVQLNALFEAALIHFLTQHLGVSAIEREFRDMAHARRIQFAASLGILQPHQQRFMETLNWLRNQFAHRIENMGRTVSDFVSALPATGKHSQESFRAGIDALSEQPVPKLAQMAAEAPATMILVSALATLAQIHEAKTKTLKERERERGAARMYNALAALATRTLAEAGIQFAPGTQEPRPVGETSPQLEVDALDHSS